MWLNAVDLLNGKNIKNGTKKKFRKAPPIDLFLINTGDEIKLIVSALESQQII